MGGSSNPQQNVQQQPYRYEQQQPTAAVDISATGIKFESEDSPVVTILFMIGAVTMLGVTWLKYGRRKRKP